MSPAINHWDQSEKPGCWVTGYQCTIHSSMLRVFINTPQRLPAKFKSSPGAMLFLNAMTCDLFYFLMAMCYFRICLLPLLIFLGLSFQRRAVHIWQYPVLLAVPSQPNSSVPEHLSRARQFLQPPIARENSSTWQKNALPQVIWGVCGRGKPDFPRLILTINSCENYCNDLIFYPPLPQKHAMMLHESFSAFFVLASWSFEVTPFEPSSALVLLVVLF